MDKEAVSNMQEAPEESEKMVPMSRVNEIVRNQKGIAAENIRKELEARHAEELSRLKSQSQPAYSDDTSSLEDRVVNRLMAEAKKQDEAQQKLYEDDLRQKQIDEANQLVHHYTTKMAKGKDFFDDFEEVMSDFAPQAFPQLVFMAANEENTPAIMYELAKNPMKLASLQKLAEMHPGLAEKEMKKLAQSISQNQQAVQENIQPPQPLSRLKSSQSTGVDSGKMSVADFKNADWLRPTR